MTIIYFSAKEEALVNDSSDEKPHPPSIEPHPDSSNDETAEQPRSCNELMSSSNEDSSPNDCPRTVVIGKIKGSPKIGILSIIILY